MPRTYGYAKIGDRGYDTHIWKARKRENVIATLIDISLAKCGIVNRNVDSNIFNNLARKNISSRTA